MLLYSSNYNEELGTDEEILKEFKNCTNWDWDYEEDETVPEPNIEDPEVQDWIDDTLQLRYEDFFYQLPNIICILHGTIGTWMGAQAGGSIDNLKNLIRKATEDYTKIVYDEKNGVIEITAAHHDGTNYWTIKALTKKGEEYWQNHYYDDPRTLHHHILNTKGYTKKIKFWL